MNLKETLENAIEVASLKGYRYVHKEPILGTYRTGMWNDLREVVWNPLVNDGDAFRLLADLMNFEPYKSRGYFPADGDTANLKRSVTVAAANIGRSILKGTKISE